MRCPTGEWEARTREREKRNAARIRQPIQSFKNKAREFNVEVEDTSKSQSLRDVLEGNDETDDEELP